MNELDFTGIVVDVERQLRTADARKQLRVFTGLVPKVFQD